MHVKDILGLEQCSHVFVKLKFNETSEVQTKPVCANKPLDEKVSFEMGDKGRHTLCISVWTIMNEECHCLGKFTIELEINKCKDADFEILF